MWVFIIFALVPSGVPENPIQPLTRSKVFHYTTQEACNAGAKVEATKWLEDLPVKPMLIASKCILVVGPAGEGI